jgi:hypothetical protein
MAGVLDLFGQPARKSARTALEDLSRDAMYYIPPELRSSLETVLGLTPTAALTSAGQAAGRMLEAGRTPAERVIAFNQMLADTAGVAAPMMVANRAGIPAAQAAQEALLGMSVPASSAAQAVIDRANQPNPVIAAGRRAADIARRIEVDPNALGSMGGNIRLGPQAVDEADEITLFHGSPYDFRSFDTSQIGKGEGAQDLGRGFSLTDEEVVAHSYMNPASRWGDLEAMERYRQAGPGRTYQVGLKARPEQFLDWKKPWKDQVPEGTPIYDKIQESMAKSYADDPEMQKLFQQANLSSAWRDDFGMEEAALKSGFVGNKRQNFTGDTEFTVFDPSKIEIKKVFDNEGRELPIAPSSPAQEVAGLLSSGRAADVTDEMLTKFTPKDEMELFELYQRGATGMDLPMDEASRMARKQEIGHDKDLFHGGKGGHSYLSADEGTGKTSGTGAFLSPSNLLAETYSPVVDGAVYPVSSRSSAPIVNADMQNWNNIEAPVYAYDPRTMEDIEVIGDYGRASTDDIARNARGMAEAIEIQDVSDRGPRAWGMTQYPAISDVRVEYDPRNLRSRFARFDPRLSHLRNLSAGVGGLGLLSSANFDEDYN